VWCFWSRNPQNVWQAGADEETMRKTEELELRKLDKDDVKARMEELSKMRSLLFHQV